MGITEELFVKVLELCVEIRRKYRECVDECLLNTALAGFSCWSLCREEIARKYNLSIKALKECTSIEKRS